MGEVNKLEQTVEKPKVAIGELLSIFEENTPGAEGHPFVAFGLVGTIRSLKSGEIEEPAKRTKDKIIIGSREYYQELLLQTDPSDFAPEKMIYRKGLETRIRNLFCGNNGFLIRDLLEFTNSQLLTIEIIMRTLSKSHFLDEVVHPMSLTALKLHNESDLKIAKIKAVIALNDALTLLDKDIDLMQVEIGE
jgi:hypothetical protein